MKRLLVALAVALLLAVIVPAAAGAASPRANNPNGVEVVLDCDGTDVTVWVNDIASEISGENPAIVVDGSDSQVFKLWRFKINGSDWYYSRFSPPPSMDVVECTHPYGSDTVTVQGVFIP